MRMKKFPLTVQGTGSFSKGDHPSTLWMGVDGGGPLARLKEKTDRALQVTGIEFEKRKYTPHVTLAYLKQADELKIADFMQEHNLFSSEPFMAEHFILYESRLTDKGSVYEPVRLYKLD